MKKYLLVATMFALVSTALVSCSDDDDKDMPQSVSSVISFENVLEPKNFVEAERCRDGRSRSGCARRIAGI